MALITEVETAEGRVRGRRYRDFLSWRGIPFALPPMGRLRFRSPRPMTPWEGVRDALSWGFAPPQMKFATMMGLGKYQPMSEDCLTLNVLAPAAPSARPRPVMVYIHGGGYVIGTSATMVYGGQGLVEHGDIVYVSLNYRLGPLGYLDFSEFSTPSRPIESNLGLRDQIAALEWVRRNIAAFGGDPDNVTVFGESAGGNSVVSLMSSPHAEGLFNRSISQSADAGVCYGRERSQRWARIFLDELGAEDGREVQALEAAGVRHLGKAGLSFMRRALEDEPGTLGYAPVVDGDVLPMAPLDAFVEGKTHRVPMIIGTNRREGALFRKFGDEGMPLTTDRVDLLFENTEPQLRERVLAAYPSYPSDGALTALCGDAMFWKPSLDCADGHAQTAPTYCYRYDYAPRLMDTLGLGATHATELVPVFGLGETTFGKSMTALGGARDLRGVSRRMQGHWLRFAREGAPMDTWPRYDAHERRTMIFDRRDRVVSDPRRERREAWEGFRGYR
ncbi:carboxylesterase/lipase family protein [Tomitella fengzijianii]|uniref:Carboxylic ester hydrolase n=1 Tax=Tomitella fengzijianii TaxID=2597660 RepID=A0A516X1N9_9ACTN|nr:carboxylesterase/lipase family protein [Tomitella fengzijianii]QDQ97002.1 carboxylesterase/lipase family protein [Tomitella fengzijianii]